MNCLVIAEHDNVALKPATLKAVGAAARIGGEIQVLVVGNACAPVAESAARVTGVTRVLLCESELYAEQLPESVAALIVANAAGFTHILVAATTSGRNFMPRVAALLDVAQISDVVAVEAADTFVHPVYAGNVMETVQSADPVRVITVRTTAFDAAPLGGNGSSAPIERISALAGEGRSRVVSRELIQSARPELAAAKVVVSGGRGLGSGENYRLLLEALADRLGASLGASRAAVDAGYVPNDYQVGQTGKIVAPDLYIAIGISGAIQHLAGMKDSRVIVAINKDPDAPIFQAADYGIVGDLFEVVPALTAALA